MRRAFINVAVLLLVLLAPTAAYSKDKPIYSITLSDAIINPVTAEYIEGAIDKAEKDGAECLIIMMDTPGGLLTSTRHIVKSMMGATVPIVVYVTPEGSRAGSAGVFITLAANIAAMAPSTNIGAAHPVDLLERRSLGDVFEELGDQLKQRKKGAAKGPEAKEAKREPMEEKIMNDTVAWVRAIASTRGRNVGWAVKAVTESVSIDETEALKAGVIDLIAANTDELLEKIDGRKVETKGGEITLATKGAHAVSIPMTTRQKILAVVTDPNIAYILLMLGFYGLLFEFTHPGVVFPGVAGTISVILALYSLHLLAANYAGVALIILSIILFILEVKVISYGVLTIGGLAALVLGSLMLFNSSEEFMRVSIPLIASFAAGTLAVVAFLGTIVVRSHRRRVVTGSEGLTGSSGKVESWSGNSGKIFVHGEVWNAEGEKEYNKGDNVEVVEVNGIKLKIKDQKLKTHT